MARSPNRGPSAVIPACSKPVCPEFLLWATCVMDRSSASLRVLAKAPLSCSSCINTWPRFNEPNDGPSAHRSPGSGLAQSPALADQSQDDLEWFVSQSEE